MIKVMQDDIEMIPLVSFPKSGNTWVRFLLANMLKKDVDVEIDFLNINNFMPAGSLREYNPEVLKEGSPVFIKTHKGFNDYNSQNVPFQKGIYIIRDPLDMLWSYFHFINAQDPGRYRSLHAFCHDYNRLFGHWGDHVVSWVDNRENKNILLVKYEDLKANTEQVMEMICDFANITVPVHAIKKAVANSRSDVMKNMQGSETFMGSRIKSFHFVQSAKMGEGANALPTRCKLVFFAHTANKIIAERYHYFYVSPKPLQHGMYFLERLTIKAYLRVAWRISRGVKRLRSIVTTSRSILC